MESSNSKLPLLLGMDLLSLNSTNFHDVATNNEVKYHSITVEVVPKGSGELFKLALTYEANVTTSTDAAETTNAIEEVSRLGLTLMPLLPGWTVAKQCLAGPHEFGDLKTWLI